MFYVHAYTKYSNVTFFQRNLFTKTKLQKDKALLKVIIYVICFAVTYAISVCINKFSSARIRKIRPDEMFMIVSIQNFLRVVEMAFCHIVYWRTYNALCVV